MLFRGEVDEKPDRNIFQLSVPSFEMYLSLVVINNLVANEII